MKANDLSSFLINSDTVYDLLKGEEKCERKFSLPQRSWFAGYLRLFACLSFAGLIFVLALVIQQDTPGTFAFFMLFFFTAIIFFDYMEYRKSAETKHCQDLVNLSLLLEHETLKDFYRKGYNFFTRYLQKENKTKATKNKRLRYPIDDIRKAFINKLINSENIHQRNVLDAGCGNGKISNLYEQAGNSVMATELSEELIQSCRKANGKTPVVCDVNALPFKPKAFTVVNLTDILEHLDNPQNALLEINRQLQPGGKLVLSVPNSQSLTMGDLFNPLNPLVIAERLISLFYEQILPPRRMLQFFEENEEGVYTYHTAFTKEELSGLLQRAGFEIVYLSTFLFLNRGFPSIFTLLPGFLGSRWTDFAVATELMLSRLPLIKHFGANWLLCAAKQKQADC